MKKIKLKGIVSQDWGKLQMVLSHRSEVHMILLVIYYFVKIGNIFKF
jgi:hypothetical protein